MARERGALRNEVGVEADEQALDAGLARAPVEVVVKAGDPEHGRVDAVAVDLPVLTETIERLDQRRAVIEQQFLACDGERETPVSAKSSTLEQPPAASKPTCASPGPISSVG